MALVGNGRRPVNVLTFQLYRRPRFAIPTMNTWHRAFLILLVLCTCIGCDQVSKDLAQVNLRTAEPLALLGGMLHLYYAENAGAAFSLGAGLDHPMRYWLFTVGAGLMLIGLFCFAVIRRESTAMQVLAYALVLGGGMSNLLDRLFNEGRVIDFMMIKVGAVHTAIFNLADVMILAGCLLLIIVLWRPQYPGKLNDAIGSGY